MDFSNDYRTSTYGTDAYGDLLLGATKDLVLTSDGDVAGTNAVSQDCIQRLSTFASECFTDNTLGLPYFSQLLGQKAPAATWDALLQAEVLQTPGIIQLTEWKSEPNYRTRHLAISFRAVTSAGPVTYNGTVNLNAG